MKKILSAILCLLILTGCMYDSTGSSSSLPSGNSSHTASEAMITDEQLAEIMLNKLIEGNLYFRKQNTGKCIW